MYLRRVNIKGIKNFEDITWESPSEAPGWHVILGDNGSGKSTFVRAIALILMGMENALRTQADFNTWLSPNTTQCKIDILLNIDTDFDQRTSPLSNITMMPLNLTLFQGGNFSHSVNYADDSTPIPYPWSDQLEGWFSSSFGPFRRFTGGDPTYTKLYNAYPKLARHLSAFNEAVALTKPLEWLQELRFKELENPQSNEASLLANVINFINQESFLPNGATLHQVTSDGVIFMDANGTKINLEDASDGHRSILSLVLELIRQMAQAYNTSDIFNDDKTQITHPGVVLIDEIDAHLHPRWQRSIGKWLCEHFPKIQFIVTTHSALVCQSAMNGSVFKLPRPGTSEQGERVTGEALDRLLFGNILEAYGSGVFGEGIERSDEGQMMLTELARLNVKARRGSLQASDEKRRVELQSIFSLEN